MALLQFNHDTIGSHLPVISLSDSEMVHMDTEDGITFGKFTVVLESVTKAKVMDGVLVTVRKVKT